MRLRSTLPALALVLTASGVVVGPAPAACAGEGADATLVVDTGGSEYRYCVALDEPSVSGLHLIELANQQHGLSYSFGYGGQAVCMLAGVGSEEEECLEGGQPFWGYWRGDGSGGWTWSGSGGGGTAVEDGDVEGWAWGTGNDGSTHPQPPRTTHEQVCGPEPAASDRADGERRSDSHDRPDAPPSDRSRGDGGEDRGDASGGGVSQQRERNTASPAPVATPTPDDRTRTDDRRRRARDRRKRARPANEARDRRTPTPTPAPTVSAAPSTPAGAPASSEGGPPLAGMAGLVAAVLLGVGGAWFVKRKRVLPT